MFKQIVKPLMKQFGNWFAYGIMFSQTLKNDVSLQQDGQH